MASKVGPGGVSHVREFLQFEWSARTNTTQPGRLSRTKTKTVSRVNATDTRKYYNYNDNPI